MAVSSSFRLASFVNVEQTMCDHGFFDGELVLVFRKLGCFEVCSVGTFKAALVDYCWYGENPDGTWSHKPGTTPVRNYDNSNETIINPQFCDKGYYSYFLGYYALTPWGNYFEA